MLSLFFRVYLLGELALPLLQAHEPPGWMWYLEPRQEGKKEDIHEGETFIKDKSLSLYAQNLKDLRQVQENFEEKKALAVLHPTFENVSRVYHLQTQIVAQASQFQKMWQWVALLEAQNPEDNPSLSHQQILKEEEEHAAHRKLRALSQHFGLFFLFKEDCPYCHQFSPIVRHFSDLYGFEVKAISLEGGALKEFPESVLDNGAIAKLNPEGIFPALFLVSPETRQVIPLSWGMTSLSDLHENARHILRFLEGEKR